MTAFDLQSELYQPTGSMSGDGVGNQLGRPRLDRLSLLVREAVQNSWDARHARDGRIRFGLAGFEFSKAQRRWLLKNIFGKQPSNLQIQDELGRDEPFIALAVYDRGTQGLSGPTRADLVVDQPEPPNFVNFLRNVGHPPLRSLSGGTYGYGKTALYLTSRVKCLLVHTRTTENAKPVSRFMAAALGHEYTGLDGGTTRRFTGRHWWGRAAVDGVVEPVTDAESEAAAEALGLPEFSAGDLGTTIVVLAPDFEELDPSHAMRAMGAAVLHNCWPKMIDGPGGEATIDFELSWNGELLTLPRPEQYPPLHGFARAFLNLRARQRGDDAPFEPAHIKTVECDRPARVLGGLSITQFPPTARTTIDPSRLHENPFIGLARHVALLRAPGMVVRYLEGPPVPFDIREYTGVFLVDPAVDGAFANAEPPSHDDWSPDSMRDKTEKTLVRVALRELKEALRAYSSPPRHGAGTEGSIPLGAFSDQLGGLLPAERGTGSRGHQAVKGEPSPPYRSTGGTNQGGNGSLPSGGRSIHSTVAPPTPSPKPKGSSQGLKASLRIVGDKRIAIVRGGPALVVDFEVSMGDSPHVVVHAGCGVILENGMIEEEPPEGAAVPQVIEWMTPDRRTLPGSAQLEIAESVSGVWSVAVSMPQDSMIAVDLTVRG